VGTPRWGPQGGKKKMPLTLMGMEGKEREKKPNPEGSGNMKKKKMGSPEVHLDLRKGSDVIYSRGRVGVPLKKRETK